ncbi:tRNA (adenosine(37)-N6)-threonylcarbamoyltransferase complex dimerization subunit type 1 TsaB [Tessaracoccus sp. ZS01]|uniref:tRNA (adenosine(37)-N6)-threonylcarbamoyltransferase complex dimerization subunit type 1 TsaB n=1 Tax=Tessaracoccus sp. ZS01 TaxID=1906324 RepID=UPI00096D8D56|nr:tRNA (adenosine(37)-N6)-threonylcarbamoyltransferase complex dimerization subunit type 1 TsaB [Tessaracoccus sp. ZS01]MCG6566774.1 tRNA (adenosine(37)-N6)-threonylcarbamoyltransferase complex dimerization subunit type 1 TsaB [Tessaracoccus sp. ZS01]OMG57919.1 tRNA (adenosine(37)-N6)-threonylcarbamoyltransferase complex dimerization subunit type 1 TsaB [Tessaracoccus sp. ZS01]
MTWTVGIDTSHVVAVGIARDGAPVARVIVDDTRAHAEALMPSVLEVCAQAGIALTEVDEFAVGMGPGPFTGLRVGIATAWTLALAGNKPVHGVCSLDVVARQWVETADRSPAVDGRLGGGFIVAADARRKELYWATYDADGNRTGEPQVSAPTELPALPVAGAVPVEYHEFLDIQGPQALDPAVLAARWGTLAPAGDEPYYLRPADATVPGKPKSALPRLRARR